MKKESIEKISVSHQNKKYTLKDMSAWFFQIRGFPSILVFGTGKNQISGEGQSGGRQVTEFVKVVEGKFVNKLGQEKYIEYMDVLMGKN